jgi:hypothetical protein
MIIKTTSHRSREKLKQLLGYMPQGYFSFYKNGDWREVPDDRSEDVLKIKGISRSKLPETARQYIDWS